MLAAGVGQPLLLAHGAGGGIELNYTSVADALGGHRRLVGRDYPGSGSHPRNPSALTLDGLADDLVSAGVASGFAQFPILGLSLGAAVAVTAAARHPERVSGLVLTVGFARADVQLTDTVTLLRELSSSGLHRARAQLLFQACASPETLAGLSQQEHDQAIDQLAASIPDGAGDQLELASRVDIVDLAATIIVPTLVIVAGRDRLVLPSSTRRLAELIPSAEWVEYPDAGHIFTPAEARRWATDIDSFLTRHDL